MSRFKTTRIDEDEGPRVAITPHASMPGPSRQRLSQNIPSTERPSKNMSNTERPRQNMSSTERPRQNMSSTERPRQEVAIADVADTHNSNTKVSAGRSTKTKQKGVLARLKGRFGQPENIEDDNDIDHLVNIQASQASRISRLSADSDDILLDCSTREESRNAVRTTCTSIEPFRTRSSGGLDPYESTSGAVVPEVVYASEDSAGSSLRSALKHIDSDRNVRVHWDPGVKPGTDEDGYDRYVAFAGKLRLAGYTPPDLDTSVPFKKDKLHQLFDYFTRELHRKRQRHYGLTPPHRSKKCLHLPEPNTNCTSTPGDKPAMSTIEESPSTRAAHVDRPGTSSTSTINAPGPSGVTMRETSTEEIPRTRAAHVDRPGTSSTITINAPGPSGVTMRETSTEENPRTRASHADRPGTSRTSTTSAPGPSGVTMRETSKEDRRAVLISPSHHSLDAQPDNDGQVTNTGERRAVFISPTQPEKRHTQADGQGTNKEDRRAVFISPAQPEKRQMQSSNDSQATNNDDRRAVFISPTHNPETRHAQPNNDGQVTNTKRESQINIDTFKNVKSIDGSIIKKGNSNSQDELEQDEELGESVVSSGSCFSWLCCCFRR